MSVESAENPSASKWMRRTLSFVPGLLSCCVGGWVFGQVLGSCDSLFVAVPAAVVGGGVAAVLLRGFVSGPKWRWPSFVAGAAFLPLLFVTVFAVVPWIESGIRSRAFDAAAWCDASFPEGRRAWMVDDLLVRHPLVGRTRQEVAALLGPADGSDPVPDGEICHWLLGPARNSFGPDIEILEIRYHDDGRVAWARVRPS